MCLIVVVFVVVVFVMGAAYLCEIFGFHKAVCVLNLGVQQFYSLFLSDI